MTKEQVQMLRDAGISEDAIIDRIIAETSAAVSPEGAAEKKEQATPEPAPVQEPTTKAGPETEQTGREDKILAAIEKLTGAVLAQNVGGTGLEDDPEKSADDILGELLRGRP